jgi:hypothetical protein
MRSVSGHDHSAAFGETVRVHLPRRKLPTENVSANHRRLDRASVVRELDVTGVLTKAELLHLRELANRRTTPYIEQFP